MRSAARTSFIFDVKKKSSKFQWVPVVNGSVAMVYDSIAQRHQHQYQIKQKIFSRFVAQAFCMSRIDEARVSAYLSDIL